MKEKTIDKKIMFYGSVTLILTLVAILFRTLCLFFSFDADIEYYKEGFLPSVLAGFLVMSAALFLSAFVKIKKDTTTSSGRENNLLIKCASGVAAALLIFTLVREANRAMLTSSSAMLILGVVCAVFALFYFITNFLNVNKQTQAIFGFGVIVLCIMVLFVSYFDVYELFNGPNKIHLHLSLIALMLFMINEIRAFAGEINKSFYVFSLSAATFFLGVGSIPTLIYYLSSSLDTKYLPHNTVLAGVFFYLVARFISFVLASRTEDTAESET